MVIDFVRLTRDDLLLLAKWFEEPHVRRWWIDADSDPDHLEAKYGPRIDGGWPEVFVVYVDGAPVGFVQWCPMEHYAEWYADLEDTKDAIGIDYLIGEPDRVGQGLGTRVIGEFVSRAWVRFPNAGGVAADPQPGNTASCRVLEKNGFHAVFEGRLPNEPVDARVYRLDRP
ncbi:MAG: GNAT family N-acetyltransferase [Actinomycetota bacterium]